MHMEPVKSNMAFCLLVNDAAKERGCVSNGESKCLTSQKRNLKLMSDTSFSGRGV